MTAKEYREQVFEPIDFVIHWSNAPVIKPVVKRFYVCAKFDNGGFDADIEAESIKEADRKFKQLLLEGS